MKGVQEAALKILEEPGRAREAERYRRPIWAFPEDVGGVVCANFSFPCQPQTCGSGDPFKKRMHQPDDECGSQTRIKGGKKIEREALLPGYLSLSELPGIQTICPESKLITV